MKKEELKRSLSLQIDYLEGKLSAQDEKVMEELIQSDAEFECDLDNLLMLGIVSGERLETVVQELEKSKNEFLDKLFDMKMPTIS